jgi:outer membrane biosynthesis protein TonB
VIEPWSWVASGGHSLLAPAALGAIKQWRYEPTLFSGEPVEVCTEVDVPFTLSQ